MSEEREAEEINHLLVTQTWEEIAETESMCPACGDWMDFCQGHGEIGDPAGWSILQAHEGGKHDDCFGGDLKKSEKYCTE